MRKMNALAHRMGFEANLESFVLVGIPAMGVLFNGLFLAYAVYRMLHG